jgi:hypothetical protein
MAVTLQNKTIIPPTLADVLFNLKQDIFSTMNCVKIGKIIKFDGTKKTAQIQILFKRVLPDGTIQSLPLLVDCPVLTPQGGGGALQFPIAAGDQCLVLFSDRRIDEWLQNGAEAAPGDGRMHDLSDGIAIVGLNALNSSLPAYPTNKVLMTYQGSTVELDAAGIKFIGSGGGEIDIQAAITTIKNGSTTLFTLIGAFLTMLEALTIADDEGGAILPLTAASIAAIEAFRAQFAALLG